MSCLHERSGGAKPTDSLHMLLLSRARCILAALGLTCEQVRSSARVFHFGVGVALNCLDIHEPCPEEFTRDILRVKEHKVQYYRTAKELLDVNRTHSDVEG